jgi:hypothetical protein
MKNQKVARDDGMKTTHNTGYRFVVNGTVRRCKIVVVIWFSRWI